MRVTIALVFTFGVLGFGCAPRTSTPVGVEVCFSPEGQCAQVVVNALRTATNAVLVQAYSFTSAPIAGALVDAHRRGIQVKVILDDSQASDRYSSADFLKNSGIPTYIDSRHAIAHNKIMIIDEVVVITGSFNFTKAADEKNAENLLVINDPVLASKYLANWQTHARHSVPYERKARTDGARGPGVPPFL